MKNNLKEITTKEYIPGYHGKMIHTDHMTLAFWEVTSGAVVPQHDHPHEQVLHVIEGEFLLIVDGIENHLKTGDVFILPSHVSHGGRALTDCRLLDVFTPVREDYKSKG